MTDMTMEEYLAEAKRRAAEKKAKEEAAVFFPAPFNPVNGGSWVSLLEHGTRLGAKVQLYNGYCNYWMPNNMAGYSDFEFEKLDEDLYLAIVKRLRQYLGIHQNYLNYKVKNANQSIILHYRVQRFAGIKNLQSKNPHAGMKLMESITTKQAETLSTMLELGSISFDTPEKKERFTTVSEIDTWILYTRNRDIPAEEVRDKKATLTPEEKQRWSDRLDVLQYIDMAQKYPDNWPLKDHTLEELQSCLVLPDDINRKKKKPLES